MKMIYDLTVALSNVVHGMFTIASTNVECVLSRRDTTCERASSHSRICAVSTWIGCLFEEEEVGTLN